MYQILFNVIFPVFFCAGLGYYWVKSERAFHMETVTGLVTNVGAPLLVFTTLVNLDMALASFLKFGAISFLSLVCFVIIGFLILKLAKLDYRDFLPSLIFPNSGNMGMPLCYFAFGQEGLTLALAVFTVYAILQFTFGVWLASGSGSLKLLVKTPLIYSVVIALSVKIVGIPMPIWVLDTTELLGGITIPLMLMALGVSLASLSVKHLKLATFLSIVRLSMGFIVGFALAEFFQLEGVSRGVLILECAMPVAVFNYLFSLRYNRAAGEVAGTILVSTLMSFLTLPFLLLHLME